jgi:uroporphyrinogen-III synthase
MIATRPLALKRVVVTRAATQASALAARLEELGATIVYAPTIRFETEMFDVPNGCTWVVVTSPNGVEALSGRSLQGANLAVVGPGTAEAARAAGYVVDLIPPRAMAESLLSVFPDGPGRVALVQADIARPTMLEGLREKGWDVAVRTAYRTLPVPANEHVVAAIASADAITFTSGSTVHSFVAAYGKALLPPHVISIGPVTTAACQEYNIMVTAIADPHTVEGLVCAVNMALCAENDEL